MVALALSTAHAQSLPPGSWKQLRALSCGGAGHQAFLNAVTWLPNAQVGFAAGACRNDPDSYYPLVYRVIPSIGGMPMQIYAITPTTSSTILNAVSADSPTDIWVAGYTETSTQDVIYVQRSTGTAFHPIACPNPGNNQNIGYGVLAFAPNNVFIAGTYNTPTNGYTYLAHWDGKSCTLIDSPNPSPTDNAFFAISGTSPQDIWLVGDNYDSNLGVWVPLCIHYDGANFTQYTCPLGVSYSYINKLVSVSAIPGGYAWAGGYETDFRQDGGLTEYFSNGFWQVAFGPISTCFTDIYRVWGVAGVNPNFAWEVAECQGDCRIGFWNNGQWYAFPCPQLPQGTNYNVLFGVSASDTHSALAVGNYNIGEGNQLPLIAIYSDGTQ
jgi:hypothetical protein